MTIGPIEMTALQQHGTGAAGRDVPAGRLVLFFVQDIDRSEFLRLPAIRGDHTGQREEIGKHGRLQVRLEKGRPDAGAEHRVDDQGNSFLLQFPGHYLGDFGRIQHASFDRIYLQIIKDRIELRCHDPGRYW